MAYIINRYSGAQLTTVEDGTVDDTTEIKFIGKNYAGYGEQQNENFLFLLENFSGTNAPTKALTGMLWYDATSERIRVYDGTQYKTVSGAEVSASQPTGLSEGDLWWNTTTNQLYAKNADDEYNLIGPQSTSSGTTEMRTLDLIDSTQNKREVLVAYNNDEILAIISRNEFTPQVSQPDVTGWSYTEFPTIKSGFTLRAVDGNGVSGIDSTGETNYFWGSASNALRLGGDLASDYLKITALPDPFPSINFGDDGFTIGNDTDIQFKIDDDNQTPIIKLIRNELRFSDSNDTDQFAFTNTAIYPMQTGRTLGTPINVFSNIYATTFTGTATEASTLNVNGTFRAAATTSTPNTVAARDGSGDLYANLFNGTATQARYADLAEKYTTGETELEPGTAVAVIADDCCEVGPAKSSDICIGVVSTNPAIMMNSEADGQYIALKGRVPVKVEGPVKKGQAVYAWDNGICKTVATSALVGVALESNDNDSIKLVECVLKV